MLQYSQIEKSAIINILSLIMQADRVIHPKEIDYLDNILLEFGMDAQDLDHLGFNDFMSNKDIINKMDKNKLEEAKRMFSEMASIDGYIDPRESEIIQAI